MPPPNNPPGAASAPSLDPQAILKALFAGATLQRPIVAGADGREHLILPEGFRSEDVTDRERLDRFARAKLQFDDRQSLVTYINRHRAPASVLIADYDKGEITAHLDWHPANEAKDFGTAGAARHRATLTMRPSEEFKRWDEVEGKMLAQDVFARFLEENATDIYEPEPTVMMEIARDLEAASGHTIKARTRLENGDMGFTFEKESRVTSNTAVPTEFVLMIPVYHGEEPEALRAKFRWRVDGGLTLGFVWHRVEYMRRARFAQVAHEVAEATGLSATFGRILG